VAKQTGRSVVAVERMANRLGLRVTAERKSQTARAYKAGRDTEEFRAWASSHGRKIMARLRASMSDAEWFQFHSHAGKTNRAETNRRRAIRLRLARELVAKTAGGDKFSMRELQAFREFLNGSICCDTCRALEVEAPKHRSVYVVQSGTV
jgi:hypothetical protein